jgi:hypothetical protein
MRAGLKGRVPAAIAIALAISAAAPAAAGARANALFGVVSQSELTMRDYKRMDAGNVATLRFGIWWNVVQPAPGRYDWSSVDPIVAGAASAGVRPLPFVFGTPSWLAKRTVEPPVRSGRQRRSWQRFLRAAVERYGPGGEFWSGRSRRKPVTEWQVWNEANFSIYWRPRPSAQEYAELVALAERAIHAVDPRARILLAGLAPVLGGLEPWEFLEQLYETPGVERHFDAVALHPYSPSLYGIKYQLRLMRGVMAAAGDGRTPLAITEMGWASGGAHGHSLVRSERGQARMLERSFSYLRDRRAHWRLSGVSWYAWQDTATTVEPVCDFCPHSGLFRLDGTPKPAWNAFRRFSVP